MGWCFSCKNRQKAAVPLKLALPTSVTSLKKKKCVDFGSSLAGQHIEVLLLVRVLLVNAAVNNRLVGNKKKSPCLSNKWFISFPSIPSIFIFLLFLIHWDLYFLRFTGMAFYSGFTMLTEGHQLLACNVQFLCSFSHG